MGVRQQLPARRPAGVVPRHRVARTRAHRRAPDLSDSPRSATARPLHLHRPRLRRVESGSRPLPLFDVEQKYTFEFFEAPAPWGPWRHLHSHDFGHFPWHGPRSPLAKHGGYAPTIPSKFLSADGRDLWLQSNWFVPASSRGGRAYCFGLRARAVRPGRRGRDRCIREPRPRPRRVPARLPRARGAGVRAQRRPPRPRRGLGFRTRCGRRRWGYEWPSPRVFDRVVYASGPQDSLGGWFADGPRVEARVDGEWMPVPGVTVTPPYRNDFTALEEDEYVFEFAPVTADGVRLVGTAGGPLRYTSIAEARGLGAGARSSGRGRGELGG